GQARRRRRVIGGAGRTRYGVAARDRAPVHRHVAVRALGLVGEAAVDEGVVDLLRDRLGVGDATLQAPRPAVHAAGTRSMKLSRVTNWLASLWKFGVMFCGNWVSDASPSEPLPRSPRI